jgi:hypothetical protein
MRTSSPPFGADTADVMRDVLGMTDEEFVSLTELGVFM